MTQITELISDLTPLLETEKATPESIAGALLEAGWVKTSDNPAEFMADSYTDKSGANLQTLVNFLVEAHKKTLAPAKNRYESGDYVQVLKDGVWVNGQVGSVTPWGHIDVDTERGPVSVMPDGTKIRRQV